MVMVLIMLWMMQRLRFILRSRDRLVYRMSLRLSHRLMSRLIGSKSRFL